MYALRSFQRAALRLSRHRAILSAPRSITTRTPAALRIKPQPVQSLLFNQRRWASDETKLSKELGEAEPVETLRSELEAERRTSKLEPADSEAAIDSATAQAATAESTEAAPPVLEAEPGQDSLADAAIAGAGAVGAATAASAASSQFKNRGAGMPSQDMVEKETVYVGNLFFDITDQDLKNELSKFGTVVKSRIITDNRGLSKGFGYVEFSTLAEAQNAIEGMHQQVWEGRRVVVAYAQQNISTMSSVNNSLRSSPRNPAGKTLFIGNMSFEMTDRDLNLLFKEVKNVLDVRVAIDRRTGQPRGFAHADFLDVESAQTAYDLLNGKEIYGRRLRVDFSAVGGSSDRTRQSRGRREGGTPRELGEREREQY